MGMSNGVCDAPCVIEGLKATIRLFCELKEHGLAGRHQHTQKDGTVVLWEYHGNEPFWKPDENDDAGVVPCPGVVNLTGSSIETDRTLGVLMRIEVPCIHVVGRRTGNHGIMPHFHVGYDEKLGVRYLIEQ